MSKFLCVCGETMRISGGVPNPVEWLLVDGSTRAALPDVDLLDAFYDRATHAFICPISAHVWIFWDGLLGPLTGYRLDSGCHSTVDAEDWNRTAQHWLCPIITTRCCHLSAHPGRPEEIGELEEWWTISDVAFDAIGHDVRPAELDSRLLPVRRCAAGDHLVVWWKGAEYVPSTYSAVGVMTGDDIVEAPVIKGRLGVGGRVLRWMSRRP